MTTYDLNKQKCDKWLNCIRSTKICSKSLILDRVLKKPPKLLFLLGAFYGTQEYLKGLKPILSWTNYIKTYNLYIFA